MSEYVSETVASTSQKCRSYFLQNRDMERSLSQGELVGSKQNVNCVCMLRTTSLLPSVGWGMNVSLRAVGIMRCYVCAVQTMDTAMMHCATVSQLHAFLL